MKYILPRKRFYIKYNYLWRFFIYTENIMIITLLDLLKYHLKFLSLWFYIFHMISTLCISNYYTMHNFMHFKMHYAFMHFRYNIQWYICPIHIQRLILLLIQRRSKEFHLTCGGLFIASFECFATVNNNST